MTARTVEQALGYARHGWPVLPCQPGGKQPATRHGFLDATTDPDQITWWWRRQPDANLAIATGQPGPDVLDVDQHGPAGNGFAAFGRLRRAGLLDGASAIVATPNDGLHAYFTGSDQHSGKLPRQHLDFRAQGGYILAPPSQVGGKPYKLISHRDESGGLGWNKVTGLLEPERHTALRPAKAQRGDLSHRAAWMEQQHEGNRNDGLFWAACRAAETGDETVLAELANAARSTGLADREIAATIRSARRTAGRQVEHQGGREAGS
jgi:Bifunctional DNA primase/polymerase, N-terminal